jgi:hypothetical protein
MTGEEPTASGHGTEDPDRQSVGDSGNATAARGGKANTGIWNETHHHHHHHQAVVPVDWPVRVGQVPALASAFQARPGLRDRIAAARGASSSADHDNGSGDRGGRGQGAGVVLTQVLSGGGGVGKSQMAASHADEALHDGTDLVVWVDASALAGDHHTLRPLRSAGLA